MDCLMEQWWRWTRTSLRSEAAACCAGHRRATRHQERTRALRRTKAAPARVASGVVPPAVNSFGSRARIFAALASERAIGFTAARSGELRLERAHAASRRRSRSATLSLAWLRQVRHTPA